MKRNRISRETILTPDDESMEATKKRWCDTCAKLDRRDNCCGDGATNYCYGTDEHHEEYMMDRKALLKEIISNAIDDLEFNVINDPTLIVFNQDRTMKINTGWLWNFENGWIAFGGNIETKNQKTGEWERQ